MLVMAVMAVVAGLVLPNLFEPARGSLDDSARRMVRVLHLAAEEAELRGVPVRFTAWSDHYGFDLADENGGWLPLDGSPFGDQRLPGGVKIGDLKLSEGVRFYGGLHAPETSKAAQPDEAGDAKQAAQPLGSVTLMSDGMLSPADVILQAEVGNVHIELRPGPGGVRIVDDSP